MSKCRRDPNPDWNQNQTPNTVRNTSQGREAIWFKPKAAPKPEKFDYSVPHQSRAGWRVYFLLLCALAVPVCCVVRLVVEVL